MKKFTVQDVLDFFKSNDERLQKKIAAQHKEWVQLQEDLQSGKRVISPKEMPFVLDSIKEANKKYAKILEIESQFQESRMSELKRIQVEQKSLREEILETEKELGHNYLTENKLFRCILGME